MLGESLGIPNVRGTIVLYDDIPKPPEPPIYVKKKKKKFPWTIYFRKFRERY